MPLSKLQQLKAQNKTKVDSKNIYIISMMNKSKATDVSFYLKKDLDTKEVKDIKVQKATFFFKEDESSNEDKFVASKGTISFLSRMKEAMDNEQEFMVSLKPMEDGRGVFLNPIAISRDIDDIAQA